MNPPLRVLHVITGINRGGAENHLMDLVRHQCAAGMRVSVAYLRGGGYWAQELRAVGAEVHALRLRFYGDPRPLLKLRRLIAGSSSVSSSSSFSRSESGTGSAEEEKDEDEEKDEEGVRRVRPFDLLHAHLPPAELYARFALLGMPAPELPLVISKHNDCAFHPSLPGERALGRWVARRASAVIAISDAVARYMTGPTLGLPLAQVETIPYGIDVQPFARVRPEEVAVLRREWGADARTLLVGFTGRLVEQKDIGTLLRAFALFVSQQRCEARLVVVGAGPLEAELRRCAAEAGVAEHVVWAGFREDVPRVMHAFDVFALTSVHEGFGLVLVEAMAAKRPVVATRAGAIPEVVADGETGFLADVQNAEQIAAALARLTDGKLRAQLGAAGHRRAFEHFTLEQMWEKTDALYARCRRAAAPCREPEVAEVKA